MSRSQKFTKHLLHDDENELKPVITDDGISFIYIKHNNLYLMAMTEKNANCMIVLNFLYSLVEVLESYFNELNEESIRDNFVITYELLDEVMDFGYPQTTESKILMEFICVKERHKFVTKPPSTLTNTVSWRSEGIVHKKNEIFLDVVEKLNLLVSANGTVLRSEIVGALKMKSYLSGMPELKLGRSNRVSQLEECRVEWGRHLLKAPASPYSLA